MFQSSFNRDEIRKQIADIYPELLLSVENFPLSTAGNRYLNGHPQIESLFDLVMTSYPEDKHSPSHLLNHISLRKLALEHQAAIQFIDKIVRDKHRIYRNSTIFQLQKHFELSDKPDEFFRHGHSELVGFRGSLLEEIIVALPEGYLNTVDELLALTRYSLFDLILDKGLTYEYLRVPNLDFLTAAQDYCRHQTSQVCTQASTAPLQHSPHRSQIAEYHEYKQRLGEVESDKLERYLWKWSAHVRAFVKKKNTVFIQKNLADALYHAHTWYQWTERSLGSAKTDSNVLAQT